MFLEDEVESYESVNKQFQFELESRLFCGGNCYQRPTHGLGFDPDYIETTRFEVVLPKLVLHITAPNTMQSEDVVKSVSYRIHCTH